jgi:hypothetical protein
LTLVTRHALLLSCGKWRDCRIPRGRAAPTVGRRFPHSEENAWIFAGANDAGGSMAASLQPGMDHADVLIIGAGAAGGVAARRLLEGGLTVVALEQGQWQDRMSYRGSQWDWELTSAKQWSQMPEVRCALADYPIDTHDSDMGVHNFNGVGGGTVLFNAIWPRLLPSNFDSRLADQLRGAAPVL